MKTTKAYTKPWPGSVAGKKVPVGTPIEKIPENERTGRQTHRWCHVTGHPFLIGPDCLLDDFDFYEWELEKMGVKNDA
jgi:hypothetical protein